MAPAERGLVQLLPDRRPENRPNRYRRNLLLRHLPRKDPRHPRRSSHRLPDHQPHGTRPFGLHRPDPTVLPAGNPGGQPAGAGNARRLLRSDGKHPPSQRRHRAGTGTPSAQFPNDPDGTLAGDDDDFRRCGGSTVLRRCVRHLRGPERWLPGRPHRHRGILGRDGALLFKCGGALRATGTESSRQTEKPAGIDDLFHARPGMGAGKRPGDLALRPLEPLRGRTRRNFGLRQHVRQYRAHGRDHCRRTLPAGHPQDPPAQPEQKRPFVHPGGCIPLPGSHPGGAYLQRNPVPGHGIPAVQNPQPRHQGTLPGLLRFVLLGGGSGEKFRRICREKPF